jgi:fatty acid-binding protein DegV
LLASEFGNVKVFEFAFAGDNYKQIIKDIFLMKEETISKIEEYINQINKKNVFSAVIGETKYLVRGGRISFLKGFLASLFQFKIILQVNCENGLTFYSKTRK